MATLRCCRPIFNLSPSLSHSTQPGLHSVVRPAAAFGRASASQVPSSSDTTSSSWHQTNCPNRPLSFSPATASCHNAATLSSSSFLQRPVWQKFGARHFSSTRISMGLKTGIVGLPNVGKSTLFNAMVENGKAQAANFPFCTIEPNVGIVAVPDNRLLVLQDLSKSQKVIPAIVEFVDIAGLVKGASKGEGLGNKFLSHIRSVDCVVQVVRCFEDDDVIHVNGRVDPVEDIAVINFELALADLGQIEKRFERLKKGGGRAQKKEEKAKDDMEIAALERIQAALEDGKPARSVELSEDEQPLVDQLQLLTAKPVVYAANVAESDLANPDTNKHVQAVRDFAKKEGAETVVVSAQVEAELTDLDAEERSEYLSSLGVTEGGLGSLVRASYALLGLRTYFTSGEKVSGVQENKRRGIGKSFIFDDSECLWWPSAEWQKKPATGMVTRRKHQSRWADRCSQAFYVYVKEARAIWRNLEAGYASDVRLARSHWRKCLLS